MQVAESAAGSLRGNILQTYRLLWPRQPHLCSHQRPYKFVLICVQTKNEAGLTLVLEIKGNQEICDGLAKGEDRYK